MKINKRTALFFLIINSILVVSAIGKIFYFHETLIRDFNHPRPQLHQISYAVILTVQGIAALVLYIGLLWIIRVFKEQKWIWSGIIVFLVVQLRMFISVLVVPYLLKGRGYVELLHLFRLLFEISVAYMVVTFFAVSNRVIRVFFWCFAVLMGLNNLLAYLGPKLYDNFSIHWLLINPNFTFWIPWVASLALFAKVFNLGTEQRLQPEGSATADQVSSFTEPEE